MYFIACLLPNHDDLIASATSRRLKRHIDVIKEPLFSSSSIKSYEVRVKIGRKFARTIGFIRYEKESGAAAMMINSRYDSFFDVKYISVVGCLLLSIVTVSLLACFVIFKKRQNKQTRQLKRMQAEFENLEMRVARECKEAFTELQMDIGELANTLNQTGAPFNDFQVKKNSQHLFN